MEAITSAQQQLPLYKNGHLGLQRKRRQCGYCGFNVTININGGGMRVHGPKDNRCIGSGVQWTPKFHRSTSYCGIVKRWGTCGICGDVREYEDLRSTVAEETHDALEYLVRHNHERPHIFKDRKTGRWTVMVANHRSGKKLTIESETQQGAWLKAVELVELQKETK